MRKNYYQIATAAMISLLLLGSCRSAPTTDTTFHNANMDFGLIQNVAVLPFVNLTASSNADERVRDVLMTMLQASVDVYVIPPGEVARSLSRIKPSDFTQPTAEEAIRLAENLGADVLITGTVLEYGEVRSGVAAANVCSASVKMLEGQTGQVVWSAAATNGGVGASERLLGGGGQPMNIVTTQTVRDLINQLFQ